MTQIGQAKENQKKQASQGKGKATNSWSKAREGLCQMSPYFNLALYSSADLAEEGRASCVIVPQEKKRGDP
jgi:hypothetical protein